MAVALITGGSRGLGLALARALADRGWDLVLDARGAEALEAAAVSLRGTGPGRVTAMAGDVADPATATTWWLRPASAAGSTCS